MDTYLNTVVATVTPCYGSYVQNNAECVLCVLNTLCKLKLVQLEHPAVQGQGARLLDAPTRHERGETMDDIFAQLDEVDIPF